jgi:hypothetical protein
MELAKTPQPGQTWQEFCLQNIPKGKTCVGCTFRQQATVYNPEWCQLFDMEVTYSRPKICFNNRYLARYEEK